MNWSEFQYDEKGNLIFAKNSEGKGVKLFYDGNGRIRSWWIRAAVASTSSTTRTPSPWRSPIPQLGRSR